MALQQAVNRIDHIAILVRKENLYAYRDRMSAVLGISWDEEVPNEGAGVTVLPSWDSGLELIAPLREEGRIWDRIQKFGEGSVTIVFGTPDIDAAIDRATDNGADFMFHIQTSGDEPWLKRFSKFREAKIDMFPEDFGATVTLSEIVPV